MLEKSILRWDEITLENGGGKAVQLRQLVQAGFQVPAFFCVSSNAMQQHFLPVSSSLKALLEDLHNKIAAPEQTAAAIQGLLSKSSFSPQLKAAIEEALALFPADTMVAVRSSANKEDGAEWSFAGQFASSLNVYKHQVSEAVLACWASAYQPGVLQYCFENQLNPIDLSMGVVVQQMVAAEQSGVVFSANPQGLLNEIVIVCGAGLGNGVVEGRVPTTTYYYNKDDQLYYYEQQPEAPLLKQPQINQLVQAAEKAEQLCGRPVDMEFALDGNLHFLQMRPVTTLSHGEISVLDNSNIVESYPGLSLPLTASFAKEVYYRVFSGLAARCMPSKKVLKKYDSVLQNMVHCANGRMYYQISNWYTLLQFLPMQKKIIPVWQKMLGVEKTSPAEKKQRVSSGAQLLAWGKIAAGFITVPGKMRQLDQSFRKVQDEFRSRFSPALTGSQLLALYHSIEKAVLRNWDITLLNDLYAFVFTGLLEQRLTKNGLQQAGIAVNELIGGNGTLASLEPMRQLMALAGQAAAQPELIQHLSSLNTNEDTWAFIAQSTPFALELKAYLDQYGDRSLEELKLESSTFRSSPLLLVQTILAYIQMPQAREQVQKTLNKPADAVPMPKGLAGFYCRRARIGIAGRESSRLNRSRIFGMVRSIFTSIGDNFVQQGIIEDTRDIFMLTLQEVFSIVQEKDDDSFRWKTTVNIRKEEYEAFRHLPPYSRLVFNGKPFDKRHREAVHPQNNELANQYTGTPCAGGKATGRVRLVLNAEGARAARDEILVTKMTDPGWVFLLAAAKGVVSEKGSLLSHTAIISRELNIPFIAGVDKITSLLKDGDLVSIDGDTGIIEVLERD